MPTVGVVILAAGGSRRLGTPKQMLVYDGETLIRRAARTALASACRPVAVVVGASAQAARREIADLPVLTVFNADWDDGLASSLRTGLTALLADDSHALDGVVIMLCDQPLVSPALLDSLVARFQSDGPQIIASDYDGVLGVPALFHRALFGPLLALTGDEGARHVLRRHAGPVGRVPFPKGRVDVDTREDYAALESA